MNLNPKVVFHEVICQISRSMGLIWSTLDGYELTGTRLVSWYVDGSTATYFDRFGVKYIPKKSKKS